MKRWVGYVEQMEGERIPIAALHGHVEGKRSRGRQRKIWMDNVREDLKEKKHRLDQDWRCDQKQRGLEKSCKSLIVSSLMEERREDIDCSLSAERSNDTTQARGHPFITSTRRGRGVQLRWMYVDGGR